MVRVRIEEGGWFLIWARGPSLCLEAQEVDPPSWPTFACVEPPGPVQLAGWSTSLNLLDVSFHPEGFIIRKDINRLIKSQQWSCADSWRRECDQTDPYQSAGPSLRNYAFMCTAASAHRPNLNFWNLVSQPINTVFPLFSLAGTFILILRSSVYCEAHRFAYMVQNTTNAIQQSSKHSSN